MDKLIKQTILLVLSFGIAANLNTIGAPAPAPDLAAAEATGAESTKPSAVATLSTAASEFRANPSDITWDAVENALKTLLTDSSKADTATLIKETPVLTDLGVQVCQTGPVRLWFFPKIRQAQSVLINWQETKITPKKGHKQVTSTIVHRVQDLPLPQTVELKEARIIDIQGQIIPQSTDAKKAVHLKSKLTGAQKHAHSKKAPLQKQSIETADKEKKLGRFLVIIGREKNTGSPWLKSYKLTLDSWRENSEPISSIPPFLLTNVSGKISFNANDLIFTINTLPAASIATGQAEPANVPYKLVLRLIEGRYALEGKAVADTPYNACYQFVHNLLQGKVDLAKAWLMDPKLISIPKYLGLSTKTFAVPPRIINLSSPSARVFRYRLVTFDKDDLIIDVGKSKTLWAVKAIFVAPADIVMQKIARNMNMPAAETTEKTEKVEKDEKAEKTEKVEKTEKDKNTNKKIDKIDKKNKETAAPGTKNKSAKKTVISDKKIKKSIKIKQIK